MTSIKLNASTIDQLDLSPVVHGLMTDGVDWLKDIDLSTTSSGLQLQFDIDYPQEAGDPRELSEIPEVRLWFLRLDARYPWLPMALNWETELARYVAMLVPHQFSAAEGIQYNPEALEIFVMQKIFVLSDWLQQQGVEGRTKLKFMAQMLGYELDDELFDLLSHP